MQIDLKIAQARILELENQLEDAYVKIDLLEEALAESDSERTVLREAITRYAARHRIEVA